MTEYLRHDLVLHSKQTKLDAVVDGCPKCDEGKPAQRNERVAEAFNLLAPPPSFMSTPWQFDPKLLHLFLVRAACPIVCRGYLDGDENWHQLCLDKATAAMEALGWGGLLDDEPSPAAHFDALFQGTNNPDAS